MFGQTEHSKTMNTNSSTLTTATGAVALLLSLWFLVATWSNQGLQRNLQKQQDAIQAQQLALQTLQQQFQAQQQQIESGAQLSNQVGPALIRDLAQLQIQNKNPRIETLLKKYGIEAKAN